MKLWDKDDNNSQQKLERIADELLAIEKLKDPNYNYYSEAQLERKQSDNSVYNSDNLDNYYCQSITYSIQSTSILDDFTLRELTPILTDKQITVVRLYKLGYNIPEIAQLTNVQKPAVSKMIKRIYRAINNHKTYIHYLTLAEVFNCSIHEIKDILTN